MMLTGKLSFNAVAVKMIEVEKVSKSAIISLDKETKPQGDKLSDFPDHPLQGEVIGVGKDVTMCKKGDVVLFKINNSWIPDPYMINDMGTIYSIYNETDIVMVRVPDEQLMISAENCVCNHDDHFEVKSRKE